MKKQGFFSYRIADRRGDHSDHRGHRNSELDAREDVSERVLCRWLSPHDQHRGSKLLDDVSDGRLYQFGFFGRPRWRLHAFRGDRLLYRFLPGEQRQRSPR